LTPQRQTLIISFDGKPPFEAAFFLPDSFPAQFLAQ
jgi:hypothetical protein